MRPKPKHLAPEYGAQFQDASVIAAYPRRPVPPAEVFTILAGLITDAPRVVLDAGCGTGNIARGLVDRVERVDAVDLSPGMIAQGRRLPGGDHPRLRWIQGAMETAPLDPPYALITAGSSLHWMDWEIVMPRFRAALAPHGVLAIIGEGAQPLPWDAEVHRIIGRYSTNRDYQPIDLIEELESRSVFQKLGEQQTAPVPFTQSVDDYIESWHARNGLSRDRMPNAGAAFDADMKDLLSSACKDGPIEMQIVGTVTWGLPL
jgi:trans-aconitate methyltransferase